MLVPENNNYDLSVTMKNGHEREQNKNIINIDSKKVIGAPEKDKVKIIISADVYDNIAKHSKEDLTHELGGFLIGDYQENKNDIYVNIVGAIRAQATDSQSASLKFTHETWDIANKEKDESYPDNRIIGWYHTHPTFGIFLSGYDQFIQKNFFDLPFQIAYVVDPVNKRDGFFHWDNGNITKSEGFYFSDNVPLNLWEMKFSNKSKKIKVEEEDIYTKDEIDEQRKIVLRERNQNRKKYLYQIIIKYSGLSLLFIMCLIVGIKLFEHRPLFSLKNSTRDVVVLNKKVLPEEKVIMFLKFMHELDSPKPLVRVYLNDRRVKEWEFTNDQNDQSLWFWKKYDGAKYWYKQKAEIVYDGNVIYQFVLEEDNSNPRITINIGGR